MLLEAKWQLQSIKTDSPSGWVVIYRDGKQQGYFRDEEYSVKTIPENDTGIATVILMEKGSTVAVAIPTNAKVVYKEMFTAEVVIEGTSESACIGSKLYVTLDKSERAIVISPTAGTKYAQTVEVDSDHLTIPLLGMGQPDIEEKLPHKASVSLYNNGFVLFKEVAE